MLWQQHKGCDCGEDDCSFTAQHELDVTWYNHEGSCTPRSNAWFWWCSYPHPYHSHTDTHGLSVPGLLKSTWTLSSSLYLQYKNSFTFNCTINCINWHNTEILENLRPLFSLITDCTDGLLTVNKLLGIGFVLPVHNPTQMFIPGFRRLPYSKHWLPLPFLMETVWRKLTDLNWKRLCVILILNLH